MRKLPLQQRARILQLLCEGQSIRGITRLTGASKNTVTKLLIDAGAACMAFHGTNVKDVKAKRVQVDKIWSFTYAKQRNLAAAPASPDGAGDAWTWTAIDVDTKLIVSYFVGGRDGPSAMCFMNDLRSRLANRVQLTSDGHKDYLEAVEGALGADIDYAQLLKIYGASPKNAKDHYSPADCTVIKKTKVEGNPDLAHVSTSYVERSKLTMHMRRFTRLTNGLSRKVENHAFAVGLHMMYYNFVRIHPKLRVSPAMASGVSDRLWEIGDIVALVEASERTAVTKRGLYKKSVAPILN